ncbi:DUF3306 domain-containing protein [uncultured Methylibium sp.]|uniref:DUF3306 domain-containing protein n=1 Tax=uncultured Methylibium sp. TaxID=381093 RepID=UPI0025CE25C4|nr:DUF3306 domain-containing protein [uncultured Methylibium sp.]
MSDEDSGFLSRWSRRKRGLEPAPVVVPPSVRPELVEGPASEVAGLRQAQPERELAVPGQPAAEPTPTLDDVAALAPGDEVSRFVARGVDETVKRAAVKKLFTDPHFNIMDGLDIYIDDYGKPDPIPMAMLRQMNQSKALGLFAAEEAAEEAAAAAARTDAADPAIASPPPAEDAGAAGEPAAAVQNDANQASDEDPDLQLQPDDPAGPGSAEERARPDGV